MSAADVMQRDTPMRWGPPRTADLNDYTPEERAFLAALIEAARANQKTTGDQSSGGVVSAAVDSTAGDRLTIAADGG